MNINIRNLEPVEVNSKIEEDDRQSAKHINLPIAIANIQTPIYLLIWNSVFHVKWLRQFNKARGISQL
jgi:hypothetical protein